MYGRDSARAVCARASGGSIASETWASNRHAAPRAQRLGSWADSLSLRRGPIYKVPREAPRELEAKEFLEHETGLEPATSTLATWSSTN